MERVKVDSVTAKISPGKTLKEAVLQHGEDRVFALYLLYFREKAKQVIRQGLKANRPPEEITKYLETEWIPLKDPSKTLFKLEREDL